MSGDGRGDIVEPDTGLPRLLARKCDTCVFRPGNLMRLQPGRVDDMVQEAVGNNSWIVCHDTAPTGQAPSAICRGFWDVHRADSMGCRLAVALGGPVQVEPPESGEVAS